MANTTPSTRTADRKGPADHVNELKTLVIDYAKQETVDPLKAMGRYLGWGMGGSLLIGTGVSLMLLGLLRGLQHIEVFNRPLEQHGGTWSFVPYLITIFVGLVVMGLAALAIKKKSAAKKKANP